VPERLPIQAQGPVRVRRRVQVLALEPQLQLAQEPVLQQE